MDMTQSALLNLGCFLVGIPGFIVNGIQCFQLIGKRRKKGSSKVSKLTFLEKHAFTFVVLNLLMIVGLTVGIWRVFHPSAAVANPVKALPKNPVTVQGNCDATAVGDGNSVSADCNDKSKRKE